MEIFIAIISLAIITGMAWMFNRILPFNICPICAGVSGTWLWILCGVYLGWLEAESWKLIAALAMGGSVVGIMYQVEKKAKSPLSLWWKTAFVAGGIAAARSLILWQWVIGPILITFLISLVVFILLRPAPRYTKKSRAVKELEEKMKSCC